MDIAKIPRQTAVKAIDLARRALRVGSDDPGVLANAAMMLAQFGEDIGATMALIDRALAFNPSFAHGWYCSARLRWWAGQAELAIEHAEICALGAGQPAKVVARHLIVATGAIENARLLLVSNDVEAAGIGICTVGDATEQRVSALFDAREFPLAVMLDSVGSAAVESLGAVGLGVARLALLGWLIGAVFAGHDLASLAGPVAAIAGVMVLRGLFEHWRTMVAHGTAARVQVKLRRVIYDKIAALGPGMVGRERSGALALSLIDGVEQLETYFGMFLPQFLIALLTPVLILGAIAFIDGPVALVLFGFALVALFAPALWHRYDVANSRGRQQAYAAFAAEFLDSIQGLATLKAFGQSAARADGLDGGLRVGPAEGGGTELEWRAAVPREAGPGR